MNRISYDSTKPKELKHFQDQLNLLIKYNSDPEGDHYNDIHIYQEESYIELEWEQVPYHHEWGGRFQFIEEDQVVMIERTFPDNHTELCYDEDDFNERLKEFLAENPYWEKTSYGTWTNVEENRVANISWNSTSWNDIEEKDPKDPSCKIVEVKKHEWVGSSLSRLISMVPEDVLYRTSYIVLGRDTVPAFYRADEPGSHVTAEKYDSHSHAYKLGEFHIPLNETEVNIVLVYSSDQLNHGVAFLTDTHCLICKLKQKKE